MRPKRMGRAERAFPWERGLPSPPANGRAHGPRHALRARGGLKVRVPEQCPAAAQGATGIHARDFPPVGRDRRARRDFNPQLRTGVNHQGTKARRNAGSPAEARRRRGGALRGQRQGTGDRGQGVSREPRAGRGPGRCGKMRVLTEARRHGGAAGAAQRRGRGTAASFARGRGQADAGKCGISRRGAEAQRGAATPPKAGGGEALRAGADARLMVVCVRAYP